MDIRSHNLFPFNVESPTTYNNSFLVQLFQNLPVYEFNTFLQQYGFQKGLTLNAPLHIPDPSILIPC